MSSWPELGETPGAEGQAWRPGLTPLLLPWLNTSYTTQTPFTAAINPPDDSRLLCSPRHVAFQWLVQSDVHLNPRQTKIIQQIMAGHLKSGLTRRQRLAHAQEGLPELPKRDSVDYGPALRGSLQICSTIAPESPSHTPCTGCH